MTICEVYQCRVRVWCAAKNGWKTWSLIFFFPVHVSCWTSLHLTWLIHGYHARNGSLAIHPRSNGWGSDFLPLFLKSWTFLYSLLSTVNLLTAVVVGVGCGCLSKKPDRYLASYCVIIQGYWLAFFWGGERVRREAFLFLFLVRSIGASIDIHIFPGWSLFVNISVCNSGGSWALGCLSLGSDVPFSAVAVRLSQEVGVCPSWQFLLKEFRMTMSASRFSTNYFSFCVSFLPLYCCTWF